MKLYRLEFNQKQQCFHYDNFAHKANTHGWVDLGVFKEKEIDAIVSFIDFHYGKNRKMLKEIKHIVENLTLFMTALKQN